MSDVFEDKQLTCCERTCGQVFTWTKGEQAFYAAQQPPFTPPKRCQACRAARKAQKEGQNSAPPAPPSADYDDRGGRGRRRRGDDEDFGRSRRR